jgi:hypothetical protein
MMKKFILILWISLWSCSQQGGSEDWYEFYEKFHSDSLFQISRISENFEGIKFYGDKVENITKNNWRFIPNGVYDVDTNLYKTEVNYSDDKVETRIYLENSGIDIKLTYEKIDNKWYLIRFIDNFN